MLEKLVLPSIKPSAHIFFAQVAVLICFTGTPFLQVSVELLFCSLFSLFLITVLHEIWSCYFSIIHFYKELVLLGF